MGISEIFNWIYSFEKETEVTLYEENSDLKGEVSLFKNNSGLTFKLGFPHCKLLYNKQTSFIISHKSFEIKVNHYLDSHNNQDSLSRYCNAYIYQSLNFVEKEKKYYRYYSRIQEYFLVNFLKGYKKDFSIKIDDINFKISTCLINQNISYSFLCIECESTMDFKKFKNYINNLIVSIGLFSGKFYTFEEFYFQTNEITFLKNTELYYRSSQKKYSFPNPFTKNPNEWNWKFNFNQDLSNNNKNKFSSTIDERIFTNLVELLIENPKIYFSIKMIFDFYNTPQISRVPLMFVILETICEEFKKTSNSYIEKIRIKEHALEILKRNKNNIEDGDYNILEESINKIDKKLIGNIINYEKAFNSLTIVLNDEDKKVLQKRNDFFHGIIIPDLNDIENEEDYIRIEKNYDYYSLRLYVLISKLILKKINFTGYLINYPKLFEDYNEMNLKEPYFIQLK